MTGSITRPALFIGCAKEALDIAKAIQSNLQDVAEVKIWSQGSFLPSHDVLEDLLVRAEASDFAVFVLSPDDVVHSRGRRGPSPRDNTIFEAGLFIAELGRKRVFLVTPTDKVRVPSDLAGITVMTYVPPSSGDWQAALGPASTQAEKLIKDLSRRTQPDDSLVQITPYDTSDPSRRHLMQHSRFDICTKGEHVGIIAITGMRLLAPWPDPGQPSRMIDALNRGVRVTAVLLDPRSAQARQRAEVESPRVGSSETLLRREARQVREWLSRGYKRHGLEEAGRKRLDVRYGHGGLSFGLFLFENEAFIEPYHLGKTKGLDHLCGFAVTRAGRGTHEYNVVERHFRHLVTTSPRV